MNEPAQQLDLGLGLPQRVDGADAIPPVDEEEECDQQEADRAWLERRLFDDERESSDTSRRLGL